MDKWGTPEREEAAMSSLHGFSLKTNCKRLVVGRDIGKNTSRFVEGCVERGCGEELRSAKGKVKKPTQGCSYLMCAPHPTPPHGLALQVFLLVCLGSGLQTCQKRPV